MSQSTHVRCKLCGYVFKSGWLRVLNQPNGALLLHHLSAMHRAEVKPLLERMRTEDIGTVAMEAFERVVGDETCLFLVLSHLLSAGMVAEVHECCRSDCRKELSDADA